MRLGPIPLRFLFAAVLIALALVSGSPGTVVAGDEGHSEAYLLKVRVHVLDPPEIAPGDDDQPTIVTRKRARQVQLATDTQSPNSGGAAPVAEPRSGLWARWIDPVRAFVGRLGLLLRLPS